MKKCLSAFLALVLLLGTLLTVASCSKDDNGGNGTSGNGAGDTLPPDAEYKSPGVKYDGKDVTIATYDYDADWHMCDFNTALKEDDGTVISQAIVKKNLAVENELGINICLFEGLGKDDRGFNSPILADSISRAFQSGESEFDFALPMGANLPTMLGQKGMLLDLNTIETLDLSHTWWNQNANFEYTLYGKQYTAVGDICYNNLGAPIVTYFNKTMIKENNLEDPYELAASGNWTLDKAIEMSRAVSTIGETDKDSIGGFGAEKTSLMYLLYASGVKITGRDANGNVVPTLYNQRSENIAAKIMQLIADETISRSMDINVFSSTHQYSGGFHATYAIPKMAEDKLLFLSFQIAGSVALVQAGIEFGVVPSPKYEASQDGYISYGNSWFSDHLVVPGTCQDTEMMGNVLEAMSYYSQQYVTPAVVDVSVTLRGVTDTTAAEWIYTTIESQIFDIGYIFDWGGILNALSEAADGTTTFTRAWETKETAFKKALKTTIANITG